MTTAFNILERTVWTFLEAFLGVFLAAEVTLDLSDWEQVRTALWGALAAGLFAVAKNLTAEAARRKAIADIATAAATPSPGQVGAVPTTVAKPKPAGVKRTPRAKG